MASAVNISPPAHPGPNGGSLHTRSNSRGPTCEQQDPGLHGISQDPGSSIHPQPPVFVRPFFYVHPPPPPPPPPPPFLHYQWPMPFPYNHFAAFPGMGYGMVIPPFPPHPYMDAPGHILYHPHPHVQPVDRRFLHPPVYAPSAPYQNPNLTHRIHLSHTGNVRETVSCQVQTEPIQRGRYGERSPLIGSDSGRGTGSNSPSAEVRNNTLPSSNSLMSVSSPNSIVPVCSSFQQEEVVKERRVSVPDILMSWRGGTPQASILKLADNQPQNDKHLLAYETEEEHKSLYQSPTRTKNGPVVADSANDNAERNLSSKNSETLFQILKLRKAHGERKAECRRENEPVGLFGSLKRSLPYTEKLLHSHNKSRKLPDNEQDDDETNPHEDPTEIIPYQMNSCQTERKMNESVWSVASLPPFIPTKEWLLQNGMLEPEVTGPVPMSKTLPQNDHQLPSYATEEDHDRSFYQSPSQTKNGPVVADGAYANGNAEGSLSSMDISTLYTIFKLRDDHEEKNAESTNAVRRSLLYTDELLHSQKESRKLPDNEQEDGNVTNPHADTTEIIPYQMSLNSSQMERKMNESVWSVKYLPPIPTKDWLLQNGMLEPEVTGPVPMSKTLPQNDHQLPSYETEDHEKSFYQSPTQTKTGPVVPDGANHNAEGNFSSKDSALFQILKLRKAHKERNAESRRENESVEFIGSVRRDELLHSQIESQKIPDNEQVDETNQHEDTTEIIPYQMSLNSSQMERKMNESVWSVKSLPPFIPTKDWLLQNGMLKPKVNDSVPMSNVPPQNDHQLLSYETEEDHERSFYQSPTQTKTGPVVPDCANHNSKSNFSSMDSATRFQILKLRKAHGGRNAESRRENELVEFIGSVRRDELLHSHNESQKLPDNEQVDDKTNQREDTTEIIPYDGSLNSSQVERKMNESVWSVKSLPPFILTNGMLGPKVTDSVPMSKTLPQNDHQLPSYETEEEKSFYQSTTRNKNGPVVADGEYANDDAESNLSSMDGVTVFQILKLIDAHKGHNAECRRENEPMGLVGSGRRSLPYTDELLHSQKESQKLPYNEQEDGNETNPQADVTEIIPNPTYSCQMERKMNESVWSVESLPPFIPTKEWLLQNGMLEPEVNDSVRMSKTPPQNDHQLPSYLAEAEHEKSFNRSPTRTENGPVVPDGANDNAKGNLSAKNSPDFFKLREAHEEQEAESRRTNEPMGLVDSVRRTLFYADGLLHSRKESQKIPDNEQEDGDETNPHEDTTPYQMKKMNESVWSVESVPHFIPTKDWLLQNGMLEPEVTGSVPASKTPPQNDHQLPSYAAEEEHVTSFFQSPTQNKNGPVMADAAYANDADGNAEGNLSSMDSATLFEIFKLRKAHEERNAESARAVRHSLPYTDELLHSPNQSQKLPDNEQEDGAETNPQVDTAEIIPYQVCSSPTERKMNEPVESLAPSVPTKKCREMDVSKIWRLKQGVSMVPLVKVPLASPTPLQSKRIVSTLTEEDADTNRCPLIRRNGADMEAEDGACRNKEVRNQQLCVQTADQETADVSPSKAHLVDCGVQCTELQEHKCVCEMKSSVGPSRWHHDKKKANHCPAEGGKRKKKRGGMDTGGTSSDMHSGQQEAYNRNFAKPWRSQDMLSSQQEAYNGNFCRPWKSQGRYGRNRR